MVDPGNPNPQNIKTAAVRGGIWMYGGNLFTVVFNLGVTAILARQLSPADFGLAALALVVLRFIAVLSESGVTEFIISDNQEGREKRVQVAFWFNLGLSGLVVLAGAAATPWIVRFYDMPDLQVILLLLCVQYLLTQITVVPFSLLRKALDYNIIVIIDTTSKTLSSLLSVLMALGGWGVLSLVAPSLLTEPLRAAAYMIAARWRPTLPPPHADWSQVGRYSSRMIIGSIATTVSAEGDTLIAGKTLGSLPLGLYNLAWGLANGIPRYLVRPVAAVALPAFSALTGQEDRGKSAFLRMLRVVSGASFPMVIGLFVVADLFVLTVYGPQWTGAILPLRILLIYTLRYVVGSPANTLFYAFQRPDIPMKFSLVHIPVYLAAVLIGSIYGITGIAIAVTIVRTSFGLVQLGVSGRLVRCRPGEILAQVFPALIASTAMGVGVALARVALSRFILPVPILLAVSVLVGGVAYLLLLVAFCPGLLRDLLEVLESLSPRVRPILRRIPFAVLQPGE